MTNQYQKPVRPIFYDEPAWSFEEIYSIWCNEPVFKTGFSELNDVLSQFQADSGSISGPDPDVNRTVCLVDERKKRRRASNRASARRCRWRKKVYEESLTTELNRLKVQNQEFKNRFRTAVYLNQAVCLENDRLKSEALVLWARLRSLSEVLLAWNLMSQ